MKNFQRNSHRRVAVSYITAFGVIAVCVVTTFLSIHSMFTEQKGTADLVNISGRQRMLSQRILQLTYAIDQANDKQQIADIEQDLSTTSAEFDSQYRFLVHECQKHFQDASWLTDDIADHQGWCFLSERVSEAVGRYMANPSLGTQEIKSVVNDDLLGSLDYATQSIVTHSNERIQDSLQLASLLFVITLIVLVFEAIYIFQPILRANETTDWAANHDPLTELPNRRMLKIEAEKALSKAHSNDASIGFMHIDLDSFKAVNDTLGHGAGDEVLRQVAARLKQNLRTNQLIARIGGDEFAVLFPNITDYEDMVGPSKRLITKLSEPILYNDQNCNVGCSIGLAISRPNEQDFERVLMDADIALYEAKNNGRGQYKRITDKLRGGFEDREALAKEIREAIENREFLPFFQPQINTLTGQIEGVEALARWRRADGELGKNAEFISIADNIGLLKEIDEQILELSLKSFNEWKKLGLKIPRISLNFSMREIDDADFVPNLLTTVCGLGLQPTEVSIEILESVFFDADNRIAVANVVALGKAGFTIELDDFGTGHTAITSLLDLPVDRIKLDRNLIREIERVGPGETVTRTLITLAKELNIEVLAEGVETEAQANKLIQLECNHHQGFFYARPMPSAEFVKWMQATTDGSVTTQEIV